MAAYTDKDIEDEKVKKPSGVLGTQVGHAYYYLDNVKVKTNRRNTMCMLAADEVRNLVFELQPLVPTLQLMKWWPVRPFTTRS